MRIEQTEIITAVVDTTHAVVMRLIAAVIIIFAILVVCVINIQASGEASVDAKYTSNLQRYTSLSDAKSIQEFARMTTYYCSRRGGTVYGDSCSIPLTAEEAACIQTVSCRTTWR